MLILVALAQHNLATKRINMWTQPLHTEKRTAKSSVNFQQIADPSPNCQEGASVTVQK